MQTRYRPKLVRRFRRKSGGVLWSFPDFSQTISDNFHFRLFRRIFDKFRILRKSNIPVYFSLSIYFSESFNSGFLETEDEFGKKTTWTIYMKHFSQPKRQDSIRLALSDPKVCIFIKPTSKNSLNYILFLFQNLNTMVFDEKITIICFFG